MASRISQGEIVFYPQFTIQVRIGRSHITGSPNLINVARTLHADIGPPTLQRLKVPAHLVCYKVELVCSYKVLV